MDQTWPNWDSAPYQNMGYIAQQKREKSSPPKNGSISGGSYTQKVDDSGTFYRSRYHPYYPIQRGKKESIQKESIQKDVVGKNIPVRETSRSEAPKKGFQVNQRKYLRVEDGLVQTPNQGYRMMLSNFKSATLSAYQNRPFLHIWKNNKRKHISLNESEIAVLFSNQGALEAAKDMLMMSEEEKSLIIDDDDDDQV